MKRDSFIFYDSFFCAIKKIKSKELQGELALAIIEYALSGETTPHSDIVSIAMELIKPQLEANNRKYLNGLKGGAPKGNQNAKKQPKINLNQPNVNENVNNNENGNVNKNDNTSFKKEAKSERVDFFEEDTINKVTSPPVNDSTNTKTQLSRRTQKTPPSLEEVEAYCQERKNGIEAAEFWDFYASKGWKVGAQPMKDWQAAVRVWERKHKEQTSTPPTPSSRTYTPMIAPASPPPIYFDFEKINGEMKEYRYYFKNGEKVRLKQ